MTRTHPHPEDNRSTFVVEPLRMMVTQTYCTGVSHDLEMQEDPDLGIGREAASTINAASEGALLIALKVDDHHDEVRWTPEPSGGAEGGAIEMLTRGIEVLTLALAAARTTMPPRA